MRIKAAIVDRNGKVEWSGVASRHAMLGGVYDAQVFSYSSICRAVPSAYTEIVLDNPTRDVRKLLSSSVVDLSLHIVVSPDRYISKGFEFDSTDVHTSLLDAELVITRTQLCSPWAIEVAALQDYVNKYKVSAPSVPVTEKIITSQPIPTIEVNRDGRRWRNVTLVPGYTHIREGTAISVEVDSLDGEGLFIVQSSDIDVSGRNTITALESS